MFNRRKFLAGLLGSPAAALWGAPVRRSVPEHKVWVIVGVNWAYNDEYSYQEGDHLTEHAFRDRGSADKRCAELIGEFCQLEDPDDFVNSAIALPDGWDDWSRGEQWNWLLGRTPAATRVEIAADDGYGWVEEPYHVCEMNVPPSAAHFVRSPEEVP